MEISDLFTRQFKNYGGSGNFTRTHNNLSDLDRENLTSISRDRFLVGSVILFSYAGFEDWLVITHEELWQSLSGAISHFDLKDIIDATVTGGIMSRGGRKMDNWSEILIRTPNTEHIIKVESGLPYMGLWNALKAVASQNIRVI